MDTLLTKNTPSMSNAYSARLQVGYRIGTLAALAIGLIWCGVFVVTGHWDLAAAEIILSAIALTSWALTKTTPFPTTLLISQTAFLIFLAGFSVLFDTPSAEIPRVSHLYLLVLALLGYINYLRDESRIQLAIIACCLLAFITLSSSSLTFPFARPISDDIRLMGAWVNASAAIALCCGCIYVLRREFHRETDMLRALRSAIRDDQLELYLQPQVNRSGGIVGAEALLRWKHPERGLVPPNEFIPVAEAGGLMPQLGGWVLREACRILATWKHDSALGGLTLAINVSASQFMTDSFERSALDTIGLHGIDPAKLKLELTESVIIAGMQPVVAKMEALRAEGIEFALDDFGTGYSSLSYLRRLPIRQIKIDRSFVHDADESLQGASLAKTIVQMGLDLGLTVLAEGVETESQRRLLGSVGCHEYQGYYFGRPARREEFEARVRDRSKRDDVVTAINCEIPVSADATLQQSFGS